MDIPTFLRKVLVDCHELGDRSAQVGCVATDLAARAVATAPGEEAVAARRLSLDLHEALRFLAETSEEIQQTLSRMDLENYLFEADEAHDRIREARFEKQRVEDEKGKVLVENMRLGRTLREAQDACARQQQEIEALSRDIEELRMRNNLLVSEYGVR